MAKKMDLFYILKLNVSTIIENNYNINISFDDAKKHGWVVSLGDNQLLKFVRDIKFIDFNKQKYKLYDLYKNRNDIKSLPKSLENSKKINIFQNQIDDILYVPDLISVYTNTTKKDYHEVCNNQFEVNGIKFKRLCAGAGQLRRNSVLFVNENLYDQLEEIMLCGLTKKRIGKINLSKFSAYYSLYSSSTNPITTPRVCVVKDLELQFKNQEIEWIFTNDKGERDIETRKTNINQNVWDGSGLVSVEMCEKWKKDLGIDDYMPSAFIVRSAWIKGLCVCFDWKRFAKEVAKKDYIIDAWNNTVMIDDIDVILSTSQFKMWKKYKDWEEYLEYHKKYNHSWGCSRVNKKQDNFLTPLNYQYVQSNFFSVDSIKNLADFSIDWVKKVCTGDKIYVLLYLLGCHENDKDISEVEKQTGMNIVKALMYNDEILKDKYVKNKIYKSIEKKIRQIKIGKLLVEGSYEFAIVDPYGYCEYVFGMKPKGLLKERQLWNKRWISKGSKEVAVMRSPLVSPNENQVLEVYSDNKCLDWYSTISSGVILNMWDTTLMRASDGDVDGDLLLTTDNRYLVSSVDRSLKPITYEKAMIKEQTLTYKNLFKMDSKSFNTKIGVITNLATSLICLRSQYNENSDEYKELTRRINLLRFHQGSAIDAGKGNLYIAPPRHWSKRQRIDYKKDTKEEIERKYYNNKLCGNKKSYFMCYIYPALTKKYKQHKNTSNRICRVMFGCKLEDLLKKKNKTNMEKKFVRNYYKYLPVFVNRSTMNELAWYVENVDFDLRFYKYNNDFDYKVLMSGSTIINVNDNMYKNVKNILKKYHQIYELNTHERKLISEDYDIGYDFEENNDDTYDQEYKVLFQEIEAELFKICSNKIELCDYMIYIMYNCFQNKSKAILWNVCGDEIVNNLKNKADKAYYPVESNAENGIEYLGRYYELKEVDIIDCI